MSGKFWYRMQQNKIFLRFKFFELIIPEGSYSEEICPPLLLTRKNGLVSQAKFLEDTFAAISPTNIHNVYANLLRKV